ncbi:MAG: 5'-nucleotidase C-terminal domain-containing protein [Bdellovibrionales bacterium]|nr:5'-nucleotidase C-terminal domain-containing protein [Bdellovibrionales bacterium]
MRYIFLLFVLIGFSSVSWGRVLLIQWTDAHSTLHTMSRQIYAIDQMAQEFKAQHPDGEVVVYIIGDFTSINAYVDDEGWLSIRAIKLLRKRGYTVLFTPGNHDAFDWVGKPGDIKLFIDQMQKIQKWGVKILAENLTGRSLLMDSFLSSSYPLETVKPVTHIVGLTLSRLINHSNLYEEEARILFNGVENYNQTLERVLPEMRRKGVERVILGVHDSHIKVSDIARDQDFLQIFGIEIPVMMAAHDHLVASYKVGETFILDAGSYGSFNVIDISENGEASNIQHISISSQVPRYVGGKDIFRHGTIRKNWVTESDVKNSWLKKYEKKIKRNSLSPEAQGIRTSIAQTIEGLITGKPNGSRVVVTLENDVEETKFSMQYGRSRLGEMMAETLARWVRSVFHGAEGRPVIAMFNSSAYRVEEPIPKGPVTEVALREMYPYKTEASFHQLKGKVIERLYFALRRDYILRSGNKNRYSPQINPEVREFQNRLQVRVGEHWTNINEDEVYPVAFGPWLSQHIFGQSYRIEEWLEVLEGKPSLVSKGFQEILVEFLPEILKANDQAMSQSKTFPLESDLCQSNLFKPGDQL